jgi:hypothetical protein
MQRTARQPYVSTHVTTATRLPINLAVMTLTLDHPLCGIPPDRLRIHQCRGTPAQSESHMILPTPQRRAGIAMLASANRDLLLSSNVVNLLRERAARRALAANLASSCPCHWRNTPLTHEPLPAWAPPSFGAAHAVGTTGSSTTAVVRRCTRHRHKGGGSAAAPGMAAWYPATCAGRLTLNSGRRTSFGQIAPRINSPRTSSYGHLTPAGPRHMAPMCHPSRCARMTSLIRTAATTCDKRLGVDMSDMSVM